MAIKISGTTIVTDDKNIINVDSAYVNSMGIGTTIPSSKLDIVGDVIISGVTTSAGGFNIGIQSGGVNVTSGVITAINFVGTGNTFNYNAGSKTIDVSIESGGGGGGLNAVAYVLSI